MKKLILLMISIVILTGCSTSLKSDSGTLTDDKSIDQAAEEMGKQIDNIVNQQEADQAAEEMGKQIDNTVNQQEDDQQIETKTMKSCNAIAKSSTCIEYIGSFWSEIQKKYHCQEVGTLSSEPCESGNIGGCEIGGGGPTGLIIWMYPYGGDPVPAESAKTAKPGCDMNPMGRWLSAQ